MEEKVIIEGEEENNKRYYKKVAKKLLSVIFVFIALIIGFKFAVFFMPFVIALVINRLTRPMVRFMNNKLKFKNWVSVVISVIIVVGILATLITLGINKIINEAYAFSKNIGDYTQLINNSTTWLYFQAEETFENLPQPVTDQIYNLIGNIATFLTTKAGQFANSVLNGVMFMPKLLIYTVITILATLFIGFDKIYILEALSHQLPDKWLTKIIKVGRDAFSGIAAYVKAQATIILITFTELLIGFTIFNLIGLKIQYAFTLAIIIALVDAFPLLGCGTVLIPWAVFNAFTGNISMAIAVFILYLCITIVRQLIEPKIISKNIGVHPIFTLVAMYTGFRLFGFLGFIFGPVILFMLKNIFAKQLEKGFFRDIFEK